MAVETEDLWTMSKPELIELVKVSQSAVTDLITISKSLIEYNNTLYIEIENLKPRMTQLERKSGRDVW